MKYTIIVVALIVVGAMTGLAISTGKSPTKETREFLLYPSYPVYTWDQEYQTTGDKPNFGLPPEMFAQLPPYPKDLLDLRIRLSQGYITDMKYINESYWSWPNWFPNYMESTVNYIKDYNPKYINTWCVGITPYNTAIFGLNLTEAPPSQYPDGYDFVSVSWIRSAPLTQAIIGVRLDTIYPTEAETPYETIYQNTTLVKEYITLIPYLPDPMSKRYVKKIESQIHVSPNIPEGLYAIGYEAGKVSSEFREKMIMQFQGEYTDASMGLSCGGRKHLTFLRVYR